jgi:hypothetical protein
MESSKAGKAVEVKKNPAISPLTELAGSIVVLSIPVMVPPVTVISSKLPLMNPENCVSQMAPLAVVTTRPPLLRLPVSRLISKANLFIEEIVLSLAPPSCCAPWKKMISVSLMISLLTSRRNKPVATEFCGRNVLTLVYNMGNLGNNEHLCQAHIEIPPGGFPLQDIDRWPISAVGSGL